MAKVYPGDHDQKTPTSVSQDNCVTSEKETTFTIWMKSLVCQANGCTVFDSNGKIVYRVDNYDQKCRDEVLLMDFTGNIVFTIKRKISLIFERWDGYRCSSSSETIKTEKPWFQVKRYSRYFMGYSSFQVITAGDDKYWILKSAGKEAFRIINVHGDTIAEVNRKQSSPGILLGEDVLALNVKPCIDHSFIVALLIVNGLANGKL